MSNKIFLQKLGFLPKNNASDIFYKNHKTAENYCIEVDLEEKKFNFGNKIKSESGTTLNFSQEENWVVFECIDRLLEKGYKPEDITLEKTWQVGHGASGGRLDILVNKNKRAYLMIECKTWGAEFDKAFKKLQKDGGQLFTYFQQDNKADYLMLYSSNFDGKETSYKNEIIKIEEHYREAGNVKDFYDRWNKLSKQNGIFDEWVNAYEFQSKSLTKKDLKPLEKENSVSLFNKFEAILRKHTVSDGPNAFNKIFNLFLAKIFDEKKRDTDELDFQWKEGIDDNVDFQVRLINLYKEGIWEFLRKEIEGIKDSDFTYSTKEELKERKKKILKFNKNFDIKEVFDDETFEDNARALKEIVELLSEYQVRYPRKQQHLSDFFERLLTTGLKQKAGQFFTPPPIARFIIKSLPIKDTLQKKLEIGNSQDLLPAIIDYAAGSGHFLTESMEEIQKIIEEVKECEYIESVVKQIKSWRINQFDWASKYIYGIEKDYRLVKVAKVGCYFYGDGLAQIIYGDGLDSFDSKGYRGLLNHRKGNQENQTFDFVISNPPYSVQRFRADIKNNVPEESFDLYKSFTDNSKEIECLFIERTKQFLKEETGIAGIILPSSILSNAGIYAKAREILLKYFKIIAITELGSGTFMATGTNTVILFLRRRANCEWENIKESVEIFFQNYRDITAGGIEHIFSKYASCVWDGVNFEDYISLCQKRPNENIKKHNIFEEYEKKIKAKNDADKYKIILEKEKEKLLYFILAYAQRVVIVKSGEKREEKAFLGYEFSNRRGYEGIHAIQRSKTIDECTKMFDPENENSEKANFYVYKAFAGEVDLEINKALTNNVYYANLVDLIAFDRPDFEKTISLSLKKISKIDSEWDMVSLGEISDLYQPKTITSQEIKQEGKYKVYGANGVIGFYDKYNHENSEIAITCRGATCGTVNFTESNSWITGNAMVVKPKFSVNQKYILNVLKNSDLSLTITGTAQPQITRASLSPFKIPIPPKEIQEKIVREIEGLEKKEESGLEQIKKLEKEISAKFNSISAEKEIIGKFFSAQYGYTANAGSEGDIRYLRITDIAENGKIKDNDKRFIYSNNEINKQFQLEDNDILIARSGSVGRAVIYKKEYESMVFASYLVRLKAINKELLLPEFLFYFTKTKFYWEQVDALTVKGNQLNLNAEKMKLIKIPLLSLKEQQKIISQIQKIEEQILKLNKDLQEIKNQKSKILYSLRS